MIARFAALPAPSDELAAKFDELTPREREVLELLARGRSNAEIAQELVVGEGTVKTHVARVLMKLGLRDRVQAVIFAYESGLVVDREGLELLARDARPDRAADAGAAEPAVAVRVLARGTAGGSPRRSRTGRRPRSRS